MLFEGRPLTARGAPAALRLAGGRVIEVFDRVSHVGSRVDGGARHTLRALGGSSVEQTTAFTFLDRHPGLA